MTKAFTYLYFFQRGSLLEERLIVYVEAVVKGREKGYGWLAKVLRPEAGPANYARFQVTDF